MSVKPILFNTDMVRALQDDLKTVTRRVIKPQPEGKPYPMPKGSCWPGYFGIGGSPRVIKPPYQPGDILYVRETFFEYKGKFYYKADEKHLAINAIIGGKEFFKWRPSIHMPKEAARIFLRVTDVRAERLQDITEEQARAEGFYPGWKAKGVATPAMTARQAFMWFWLPDVWIADPWVWVIEFKRVDKPEGWPDGKKAEL